MKKEKTFKQKKKEILDFYKQAFCVDGDVRLRTDKQNFNIDGIIELNDSKRGQFFIARLKQNQ